MSRTSNAVDNDIRTHRSVEVEITVLTPDNRPLTQQDIVIAQTNHKFLFGISGFDIVQAVNAPNEEQREWYARRAAKIAELFNFVTLPFYWGRFEPEQGRPMTAQLKKAAQWCVDRHLLVKGHPLCWHTVCADWLLPMSNTEILQAQLGRIQREVTDFRGLIDAWDVINEVVIMPIFDKYDNGMTRICKELGRIKMIKVMFEAARAANPSATLLLNDFDMSPAYDILVEGCLEAGIKIDALGLQSHMHQGYWGVEKTLKTIEQFSRFNLPIHFTETTLVSGAIMPPEIVDLNDYQVTDWPTTPDGEVRQAREIVQHYKTLFAHPLVAGLTYWDFADGGWLNAPAGLVRKDASSKPAYEELMKLIKGEWWLQPTHFTTNQDGKVRMTGFLGEYELLCEGKRHAFELDSVESNKIEIRL